MRTYIFYTLALFGIFSLCSCGSSKKIEKSPIKTFVMPCSELKSGDGVIRAWASGKSDSETSARKKAQVAAAAELASLLSQTVNATSEEYTSSLSQGELSTMSKSFLNDKIKVTVNKTLTNARIVCDRWTKDEQTGQYTNYMVLEIKGDDYLKLLFEELRKNDNIAVDMNLLEKLFMKHINESSKK